MNINLKQNRLILSSCLLHNITSTSYSFTGQYPDVNHLHHSSLIIPKLTSIRNCDDY